MTPRPAPRTYTRDDVLAEADRALAEAVEQWTVLSSDDMKHAGSTTEHHDRPERHTKAIAPGVPVNLAILDYLADAETELAELAGEVLGTAGAHAAAESAAGARMFPTIGTVKPPTAVRVIRDGLPTAPDEVVAEVAAAAWRLVRTGGRLLGTSRSRAPRRTCPNCGRRSVIPNHKPDDPFGAVCSVRSCGYTTHPVDPSPAIE